MSIQRFRICVVLYKWKPVGKQALENVKHDVGWYSNYFVNWRNPYGIARYWQKESRGKLIIEGKVLDWQRIELKNYEILKPGENNELTNLVDRHKAVDIAVKIAKSDGEDVGQFDGFIAVVNLPNGYGIDDGNNGSNGSAFGAGTRSFGFYAHEVGHIIGNSLGFDHSFGIETESTMEPKFNYCTGMYGYPYCIMSAELYGKRNMAFNPKSVNNLSTEEMNRGPGLNGGTKDFLGWCGRIEFDLNQNVEAKFELQSLGSNRPDSKVVHIKDHERIYTVEYRSSLDENDKGIANLGYDGVVVVNAVAGGWAARTSPGKPGSATYLGEIPLKTKDVNLPNTIINFNAHWGVKIIKWNYEKNRVSIAIVKNNVLNLRVYRRTHDIGALNDGRPFCIERKGISYWKVNGNPLKNIRSLI